MEPERSSTESESRIGRYVLGRSLGEGGMGEVFEARAFAAAGVEKELCVKRIRRERLGSARALERFIEEARLSMSLSHGNIVQVFDFGRAGDEYYLAMEWVDGADLGRLLTNARTANDPFAPVVAVHVAASIARALAYAHRPPSGRRPIIHCDLKPANVLISRSGEVKLADFGAAATIGAGIVAGTRGYMAPEQEIGVAADARVDIYALGVLLCEASGGEGLDADRAHLELLPAELRELVRTMLAPMPRDRAADAAAIADALEAWVSRARASGSIVPAADLARRATAASKAVPWSAQIRLDTEASFERDGGDERTFHDRMTAPTEPRGAAGAEVASRPNARTTPLAAAAFGAVLLLMLGVAYVLGARGTVRAPSADRSDAASNSRPTSFDAGREDAGVVVFVDASIATPDARVNGPVEHATRAQALPGTLDVNAIPWAEVTIDGRRRGETPQFGISLTPGEHVIVLHNPELGVRRTTRITVSSGEHRHVVVSLPAP